MKLKHLFVMEVVIILIFLVSFAATHAAANPSRAPVGAALSQEAISLVAGPEGTRR